MVEKIKQTKDQVLERMDRAINERGAERMDVTEVGKLADIVKDLAEAEKSCWEAEYYMSVTEAMEEGSMGYQDGAGGQYGYGYSQGGGNRSNGSQNGSQGRRGYRGQPRDSQGQYMSRRGYRYGHSDMMQDIRDMMAEADPQEREDLKRQLRQLSE